MHQAWIQIGQGRPTVSLSIHSVGRLVGGCFIENFSGVDASEALIEIAIFFFINPSLSSSQKSPRSLLTTFRSVNDHRSLSQHGLDPRKLCLQVILVGEKGVAALVCRRLVLYAVHFLADLVLVHRRLNHNMIESDSTFLCGLLAHTKVVDGVMFQIGVDFCSLHRVCIPLS